MRRSVLPSASHPHLSRSKTLDIVSGSHQHSPRNHKKKPQDLSRGVCITGGAGAGCELLESLWH